MIRRGRDVASLHVALGSHEARAVPRVATIGGELHRQVVLRAGKSSPADVDAAIPAIDGERLFVLLLPETDGAPLDDGRLQVCDRATARNVVFRNGERVCDRVAGLSRGGALEGNKGEVEIARGVEAEPWVRRGLIPADW